MSSARSVAKFLRPTCDQHSFLEKLGKIMKSKNLAMTVTLLLLFVLVAPAAAADPSASVYLPGWVGGGLAALAVLLPAALLIWLRQRGRA